MNASQKKAARWTEILLSLDELGFLTTGQIQRLHNLGGRRNAIRILNEMGAYLNTFRLDETVYYLSAAGRREIGSKRVRKRTLAVHHTLMRNEVYIHERPGIWRVETPIKWPGNEIIPDALYRKDRFVFLEIDRMQSMSANAKKIDKYRQLRETGLFQKKFNGEFPLIKFVTTTEYRKKKLRALLDGVKADVLTFEELR
ncbi:MAG TPA: replication-relaxation family protein [Brevibacillus sp.]|nr:replication-relaxation family protein [Brevibacillus sp.]